MSGDKLRDAIAGALYVRDRFDSPTVVLADAILALPEMQALLNKDDEITRLRAAGDRLAAAVNAVSCSGPRDEMAELTDAFLDWEAGRV